ncbi:MAG: glycosyltransferase family 39 protein [Candidatus Omnitrophica bacterium]|nr:glycosyltransferase family 39 protein [Candidatus Omnitrophota bacterium]
MKHDHLEAISHKKLLGILMAAAYVLLMMGNGFVSLTHPDEVFYVQSAKEMIRHNSWMTPMIFDAPHFEKPIFFFWLLALNIKLFGITPFVARFWPAFFAILGVAVTYWVAWMLFERKRLAFLSGLVLASSFIYLALARSVLTDMVFSIWVTATIVLLYAGYKYRASSDQWLVFAGVAAGLAVLTKGVLGIIFPTAVIVIFLLYKRELAFLKRRGVWLGLCVFLLIALPWHVVMYQRYGQEFIREYVYNVHIRRVLEAEHARLDNWYFYLWLMFAGILPWSFFWPPAARLVWRQFKEKFPDRDKLFFLLAWIVGVYICVQPAHSKLASYVFPVFPAIAVLIAYYLDRALRQAEDTGRAQALSRCGYAFFVFLLALIAGTVAAANKFKDFVTHPAPVYVFTILLAATAVCIFVFNRKREYFKMLLAHAGMTAALLVMLLLARPSAEPWVSCKDITDIFKTVDHSGSTVLASKFYVRGIRFYTDRKMAVIDINGEGFFSPHPVPFLNTDQKVLDFLKTQSVTYAIVKDGNVRDLKRIVEGQPYRLEELRGVGDKHIVRIEKL